MDARFREKPSSREELLKAASALMIERGSIEISLNDIAVRSGLNSALVKYYFGNKNGLLIALVEDVLGAGLEQLRDLKELSIPPTEKLKLHIQGIIAVYYKFPYINRLIHEVLRDPTLAKRVSEAISTPLAHTQRVLLAEAVAAGLIRPIDPMFFYFIVLGACDHLFFGHADLQHVFGIKRLDDTMRRAYISTLINLIFDGLLISNADKTAF